MLLVSLSPSMANTEFVAASSDCGVPSYLDEAFEGTFPPTGWTLVNNGGCGDWESSATTGRTNYTGGDGSCTDADSDWCGSGMNAELWTPSVDLSGATAPVLSFQTYFHGWTNDDHGYVWISTDGGSSWDPTSLVHYNDDVGPYWTEEVDLSAYAGESDVMFSFHYVAPGWDWYWEVDNVQVYEPTYFVYLPLVAQNRTVAPDLVVKDLSVTTNNVQVAIQN
jgi:hypothetical protein